MHNIKLEGLRKLIILKILKKLGQKYSPLIFDKAHRQFNGGNIFSATNRAGGNRLPCAKKQRKRKKIDKNLMSFTKNNAKWILDLL